MSFWKHLAQYGIVLNVADLGTTIYAVGVQGATELNPIIAPFIMHPALWLAKLVIPTLIFLYLGKLAEKHLYWKVVLAGAVGFYTLVVLSNTVGIYLAAVGL